MSNPRPANTTIVTQWVRAAELFDLRAGTSSPLDKPIWVSDGDKYTDLNGVRTATSHLMLNVSGYEDDDGHYLVIEFPAGTPSRRVALDEVIEVHSISPGSDLIEGDDPRPDLPRTRGTR